MAILFLLLFFWWEIIQNLVGFIFILVNYNNVKKVYFYKLCFVVIMEKYVLLGKERPGNSLGRFIILDKGLEDDFHIRHEFGHSIQSLILGWFYLFFVMIPSYLNYIRSCKDKEFRKRYYKVYPENWANWLGGIR